MISITNMKTVPSTKFGFDKIKITKEHEELLARSIKKMLLENYDVYSTVKTR